MGAQLSSGNALGQASLVVMPLSLVAATTFSEGCWQRVWAAESPAALRFGGVVGGCACSAAILLSGFAGFLAAWGGLVDQRQDNANLYLFQARSPRAREARQRQHAAARPAPAAVRAPTRGGAFQVLKGGAPRGEVGAARVDSWVGVAVLVLAATMNESALDSLQNGLAAGAAALAPRGHGVLFPRCAVVLATVALLLLALQDLEVHPPPPQPHPPPPHPPCCCAREGGSGLGGGGSFWGGAAR